MLAPIQSGFLRQLIERACYSYLARIQVVFQAGDDRTHIPSVTGEEGSTQSGVSDGRLSAKVLPKDAPFIETVWRKSLFRSVNQLQLFLWSSFSSFLFHCRNSWDIIRPFFCIIRLCPGTSYIFGPVM